MSDQKAKINRWARWKDEPVDQSLGEHVYDVGSGTAGEWAGEACEVHTLTESHKIRGFLYRFKNGRLWATSPVWGESWYSDEISLEGGDA